MKFNCFLRTVSLFLLFWLYQNVCGAEFEQREVYIENEKENSRLAGSLTVPAADVKAAIVLATGSGAQDRDETIFGHKPFKAIAEYLSEAGYAVLRLDDRGVGGSVGPTENVTTDNFVSDIGCAMNWLDSVTENVPVGILGHSEGGQIAYKVGASYPACDFIITLAAPAWRGDSLIMAQCRSLAMNSLGRWDGEKNQRNILDVVMSELPAISARPIIMAEIAKTMGDASKMPQMQEFILTQANLVLTPWYREFVRFDPSETIRSVKIPWLALNGDKDVQVPVENLKTIKELNPSVTTLQMSGHNHLFQHANTGLPSEYASLTEDISVDTLEQIVSWLDLNVAK